MKNIFFLIPLLFFLAVNELKVISYNIRYNNPNDGINIWENRKLTIANFLIDESPDFIGLQEVKHSQLLFLLESMINYDFIGVGRDDGKTKGNTALYFITKINLKFYLKRHFGYLKHPKKFLLVGMPQWKGFVHTGCLKTLNQKKNS